jgi:hypothetical protein
MNPGLEQELDDALGDLLQVAEVWMTRPTMLGLLRARRAKRAQTVRDWAFQRLYLPPRENSRLAVTPDGFALCWETANQQRALGGLLAGRDVQEPGKSGHRRARTPLSSAAFSLSSAARRTTSELRSLAAEVFTATRPLTNGLEATLADITRTLVIAHQHLQLAARQVTDLEPKRVVLATQHGLQARAMILRCRVAEIPTVYVPHAPLANNRVYRDLPVDLAALRGPREVDVYGGLGADRSRLYDIGDPGFPASRWDLHSPDGLVLVAPSPWQRDEVARFMRTAEEGIPGPYVVCPHPASDRDELRRLTPPRATIADRRTLEVIAAGCRALVQHSSGVAVEAMLLGAPVVELSVDDSPASYFAIAEPHVRRATDGSSLRQVLQTIDDEGRDSRSEATRAWAREWVSCAGDEATERLRSVLQQDFRAGDPLRSEWPLPTVGA